jgi:hypothetical protein
MIEIIQNAVRRFICRADSPQAIRHNFVRLSSALCVCGGLLRETATQPYINILIEKPTMLLKKLPYRARLALP